MSYISSEDRFQLQLLSLEENVDADSIARVIDVFIDSADLNQLGFIIKGKSDEGRPAFNPAILCKLYLYGYINGIRSSRKLEKACKINIELWWLLNNQKPGYKTIADFRKDNAVGFRNLFIYFRDFCISLNLYGKKIVAIDGSKFRGQNSFKNNYNQRKINKQLEYLNMQYEEYAKELEQNDKYDSNKKIKKNLDKRKAKYDNLQKQLNQTEDTQVSTSDPDARALPIRKGIVQVGYNLQSSVDDKHMLIAEYDVTNKNDHRALASMALKTREAFDLKEKEEITVLADKGYHTGDELQQCHKNSIITLVAIPKKSTQKDNSKPGHLTKENFTYNKKSKTYVCPEGHKMKHQGTYIRRKKGKVIGAPFDRYKMDWDICKSCQHFDQCVSKGNKSKKAGRYIDRYQNDEAVLKNKEYVTKNKKQYKRSQAIVEHPFGTIKRQWGFTFTLMKSIPKVQTEFSIINLCYNLRRVMSVLGAEGLKMDLESLFFLNLLLTSIREYLRTSFKILSYEALLRFMYLKT